MLSASEANKPRPPQTATPQLEPIQKTSDKTAISLGLITLLVLACGAGATLFALRHQIFHSKPPEEAAADQSATGQPDSPAPPGPQAESPAQPLFAGESLWTMDLSAAKIPEAQASGSIHKRAFTLERATLTGSNLTFRVGRSGPVELGLNIIFFNRQAEELSGKTAEVNPTDPVAPRVVLHWKEEDRLSETFHTNYTMKVEFGLAANGAIPGKLFLSLPDDSKSWVAGTFRADIRKPGPAKPKQPKPPQPAQRPTQ